MNKKIFLLIFVGILLIGLVSADFCCEKTVDGAWCQSIEKKSDCADGFDVSETSCESTTYCKTGCCFNSLDGTCSQNTAKKTCDNANGVWREDAKCQIDECEYGCCVLSNQGVWGTRTKCAFMASANGIGVDFRTNIEGEFECNLIGNENDMGACVHTDNGAKTCNFISRGDCSNLGNNASFYEDYLCSAKASSEISNICERSKETICSNGKVYFVDTCGNLANVYDADKVDQQSYWERVVDYDAVSCNDGNGNINSESCGLCDYYSGSTCGIKRSGDVSPDYGDYLCRDLSCKYEGATYKHGERWCAKDVHGNEGVEDSLPGSEHYVLKCDNGEVTAEACGEWRNKICVESTVGGISNAQCIINDWKDCVEQTTKKDCENEERRDCQWVEDAFKTTWSPLKCVPKYAPGFDFWEGENKACSLGRVECKVTYEKSLTGKWECAHNCYCLEDRWMNKLNQVCNALGDCGSSVNYIDEDGWYEVKDLWSKG